MCKRKKRFSTITALQASQTKWWIWDTELWSQNCIQNSQTEQRLKKNPCRGKDGQGEACELIDKLKISKIADEKHGWDKFVSEEEYIKGIYIYIYILRVKETSINSGKTPTAANSTKKQLKGKREEIRLSMQADIDNRRTGTKTLVWSWKIKNEYHEREE